MVTGGVAVPVMIVSFYNSSGTPPPVNPPQSDVVECTVHLGCSKEVSSYTIKLQNWDGKYSASGAFPIVIGSGCNIAIGRDVNCPQLLMGRVESIDAESTPTESYITVSGRCLGERLFRRTVTITEPNIKGEAAVKDLIDAFVGLNHVRSGVELVENTDTTYTLLQYTDSPLWDILKYLAETSDKAGVIGYDFRVAPDGKFEFFPKLSKVNTASLVDNLEAGRYRRDISRVRNKIIIYGVADKSVPVNKVDWTRSLTPSDGSWVSASGDLSIDAVGGADGHACVKLTVVGSLYNGDARFYLGAGKEIDCEIYPSLDVQLRLEDSFSGTGYLILWDSAGLSASKSITVSPDGQFHAIETGVGSAYEKHWGSVVSGFDWSHVAKVGIQLYFPESTGGGAFWIHGLYFGGRRYSATAEDLASQVAYTDSEPREYVETDEELQSDNECELRAKSLLDYLKAPAEYLSVSSSVLDYGATPILAGDKVHVKLIAEQIDSDYRVESIEYHFDAETQTLDVAIELGKEPPQIADYLYGLRTFTVNVEKLARTKVGRRGMPVVTQGGGGSGSDSHFTTNVEINKTTPVLNLQTLRAIKAAFGFDGVNAFLATYTGDLVLTAASLIIRPFADGGSSLGTDDFRWGNLRVKDLISGGSLKIAGSEVISDAGVLKNVTADAAIITTGQLPLSALPQGISGRVLTAQGIGNWPQYLDPNSLVSHWPDAHYHNRTSQTITVVTGVTVDGSGHVTGVTTQTITFLTDVGNTLS
jgi:hypothetical protein